jgi:hypothetical protein
LPIWRAKLPCSQHCGWAFDLRRGALAFRPIGFAALSRHLAIPLLSALIVATFFNVCGGAVLARPKQHKIAWA